MSATATWHRENMSILLVLTNSRPRRRSSAVSFSLNDAAVLNVNYDETNGAVDFSSSKDQKFEASMRTSSLKSPEAL
eukprot:scaffold13351_cov194-Alexandrium_tamarense.AAC.1